jgi:electron transfer flavoprotein beta subunit
MKILVCIKQVPDLESKFKINDKGNWVVESSLAFRLNEYDEYAAEEAVKLKEKLGSENADLTVLSIGPERVKEVIKKVLAMGADRAIYIKDNEAYSKDPFRISSIIYECVKDHCFDIIFTGMQSNDRSSCQVAVFLAELLGINAITTVVGFDCNDNVVTVKRELEGGKKMVVKSTLPLLLTCQLGLNNPRYPTLPNIMKAKKKEIKEYDVKDFDKITNNTTIAKLLYPEKKSKAEIIEGSINEIAPKLLKIIKGKV